MGDWRRRYEGIGDEGATFWMDIRVDVTKHGAAFLADHARSLGMNRASWIRMAIYEQLVREGVEEIPDLKPYRGSRLRMAIDG